MSDSLVKWLQYPKCKILKHLVWQNWTLSDSIGQHWTTLEILDNMHCDSLLVLVLTIFSTKQVSADADNGVWECKKETVVEGLLGEKVTFTSRFN